MAKAGRPKGAKAKRPVMGEEHRAKIKNSQVLNQLVKHVETPEGILNASQVTAGLGLLGFAYPKIQPIDEQTGKAGITVKLAKDVEKL
jgi:hypothetical protein